MFRLMACSDRLFLSLVRPLDASGVLAEALSWRGDFCPDCARRFSLLLKGTRLGLSCMERCIFSTGDLDLLCLDCVYLLTEVLLLLQSMKSCRKRGFSNFLRSY